ncbi:MFS transporter [Streptococcus dentiloxodontae]
MVSVKNTHYLPLVTSLYINYIFQGIAAIVITQNKTVFQENWGVSLSQVTLVVSAIGIGRILFLNFAGWLSDYMGRKPIVIIGVTAYSAFYLGLIFSANYWQAIIAALLAGGGNAFLDTGTYPSLVEAFPSEKDSGALSVLNKAFISIGQFIFPIATRWTIQQNWSFSVTLFVCAAGLFINGFFLWRMTFPQKTSRLAKTKPASAEARNKTAKEVASKFHIEGLALLVFSFVSVSLFNIFVWWIASFAEKTVGLSSADSMLFVSYYSLFSFLSVFATSYITMKKVNIPNLMMLCVALTGLGLLYMLLFPSIVSLWVASAVVGFFSAGGIWQLGLALLLEFFPQRKGVVTSYYSLATAVSLSTTPYFTGLMAEADIYIVFIYNVILAIIGFIALAIVRQRYRKVIVN